MTIAFCGGGTLGHIYPALSMIKAYKKKHPNIRIIFFANQIDATYLENVKETNIDKIYYFHTKGLTKSLIQNGKSFFRNIKEKKKIRKVLIQEQVTFILGMGGYLSGIAIHEALRLKLKTAIHEQNSVMGLANRLVVKKVSMVFTTFPMKQYQKNQYVVGNPRFDEALNFPNSVLRSPTNLLITSGTLGSKVVNEVAVSFLNDRYSKEFTTTLITGKKYYQEVCEKVNPGSHYQIFSFTNEMLNLMSKAGIVISRSGSTTVFEILGSRCIPIFIPSPNVTMNHQYYNAKYVESLGIGTLLKEEDVTIDRLKEELQNIKENYSLQKEKISSYLPDSSTQIVCDKISCLIKGECK